MLLQKKRTVGGPRKSNFIMPIVAAKVKENAAVFSTGGV